MLTFLRWGWSVIRHWILLMGGAVVSVALLAWAQYAPPEAGRLPSRVWWTGIAGGFVGACFLTWKHEWEIARALAVQRPAFAHVYAGLEQWEKQDGTLIEGRFNVKFSYDNKSGIPVDDLTRRIVGIVDFTGPPFTDSGYSTNANRLFGPAVIRTAVTILPLLPPHYFAIDLSYKDSRNGARFRQQMFYKWIGSREKDFDMHFRDCNIDERRLIEVYLATRIAPSVSAMTTPSLLPGD